MKNFCYEVGRKLRLYYDLLSAMQRLGVVFCSNSIGELMNTNSVIQHGRTGNEAMKHSSNLKEAKRPSNCQKYENKDRISRPNGE